MKIAAKLSGLLKIGANGSHRADTCHLRGIKPSTSLTLPLMITLLIGVVLLVGCGASADHTPVQFSSWLVVLSLAQQEADKISKNAVVSTISTRFESCEFSDNKPAPITFLFERPSGEYISVEVRDTDPPVTLSVNPKFGFDDPPSAEQLQSRANTIRSIRTGPRDACQRTSEQGKEFKTGPSVSLYTYLNPTVSSVWSVSYYNQDTGRQLSLAVSPQTGEVVTQNR